MLHSKSLRRITSVFLTVVCLGTLTGCTESRVVAPPSSDVEELAASPIMDPSIDESSLKPTQEPAAETAQDTQQRMAAVYAAGQETEARIAAGDPAAKVCYLTFDDGPSDNTLEILGILEKYEVSATFFVQGNSEKIDLVKLISDKGHAIGLHTFSHDYAQLYASDEAYYNDLALVQDAVSSRIGHPVDIVRFPGGTSNAVSSSYNIGIMSRLTQSVPANGYQYFDWNLSGGDSSSPPPPAADISNNVLLNVGEQQRTCVLMHDTTIKHTTVEALPAIIEGLRDRGYTFGMLTKDTPPFHHGVSN